jgi:hypothetical protein
MKSPHFRKKWKVEGIYLRYLGVSEVSTVIKRLMGDSEQHIRFYLLYL